MCTKPTGLNPMKSTVYLETSIIGYLASRPSRDLITAANQQLTRDWWDRHREQFDLYISEAVVAECSAGDAQAVRERLDILEGISVLDVTEAICRSAGFESPTICTPQQLMEV